MFAIFQDGRHFQKFTLQFSIFFFSENYHYFSNISLTGKNQYSPVEQLRTVFLNPCLFDLAEYYLLPSFPRYVLCILQKWYYYHRNYFVILLFWTALRFSYMVVNYCDKSHMYARLVLRSQSLQIYAGCYQPAVAAACYSWN